MTRRSLISKLRIASGKSLGQARPAMYRSVRQNPGGWLVPRRGSRNMARHYSTRDFFRQMPNALLARYFQARGLLGDLDFAAMKETQPDELFAAWLASARRSAQRDGCGVPGHFRAEL